MIISVPIYLISPISFGFLCGYVSIEKTAVFLRFKKTFLFIYLPIWILTAIIVVSWIGFDR